MTLEFVLTDEGFRVVLANDGAEALDLARSSPFDCILLDQIMPKMDGKEVLDALRADEATSRIPVVVLTGMGQGAPGDWEGAHFVGKPFTPEDLVARIRSLISDGTSAT